MLKPLTAFLTLTLLISCSASQPTGVYRNNFAVSGFFGTKIKFKPDNSFEYVFAGDLLYDSATGHYQIIKHKLFLTFNKQPESNNPLLTMSRFDNMPLKTRVIHGDSIQYQMVYYITGKKLFPAHVETGKKITKAWGYSKHKEYLLFGSHYHQRRYFLKRIA